MSMSPSRDSTKASPSRQTSREATIAKKRSRRNRSAIRYISPQSRLPVTTWVIRQPMVLKPKMAIDGRHQQLDQRGFGVEVADRRRVEVVGGVGREVHLVEDLAACLDGLAADRHLLAGAGGAVVGAADAEDLDGRHRGGVAAQEVGQDRAAEAQHEGEQGEAHDQGDIDPGEVEQPAQPRPHQRPLVARPWPRGAGLRCSAVLSVCTSLTGARAGGLVRRQRAPPPAALRTAPAGSVSGGPAPAGSIPTGSSSTDWSEGPPSAGSRVISAGSAAAAPEDDPRRRDPSAEGREPPRSDAGGGPRRGAGSPARPRTHSGG